MRKSKRSLMGIGAGALVGLCLTALSAAAQQERNVTTSKGNGDTVKVTVSGNVVLDYVYRAREMTAYTDSFSGAGTTARSGRSGGRPAALYRFTESRYRVTDEFAALRPPG